MVRNYYGMKLWKGIKEIEDNSSILMVVHSGSLKNQITGAGAILQW